MNEPRSTLCTRLSCRAPMLDTGTVCWPCTQQAILDLGTVADWGDELVIALTRMTRIGRGEGHAVGTRDDIPLPFDVRASDLHSQLHRVLTAWTERARRDLNLWTPRPAWPLCAAAETTLCGHDSCRSITHDPQGSTLSLADMARILADHPDWIRRQADAAGVLGILGNAAARMVKALDLPPEIIGLGPCDDEECGQIIKAPREAAYAECRGCGAVYDVEHRREQRIKRADGLRATPALLVAVFADLYPQHAVKLTDQDLRDWSRARGKRPPKLLRRGKDHKGRWLYRVGDVRVLYLAMVKRELQKTQRNAKAVQKKGQPA